MWVTLSKFHLRLALFFMSMYSIQVVLSNIFFELGRSCLYYLRQMTDVAGHVYCSTKPYNHSL